MFWVDEVQLHEYLVLNSDRSKCRGFTAAGYSFPIIHGEREACYSEPRQQGLGGRYWQS